MTKIAQITPSRVVIGVDTHKDLHVAVRNLSRPLRQGLRVCSVCGVASGWPSVVVLLGG